MLVKYYNAVNNGPATSPRKRSRQERQNGVAVKGDIEATAGRKRKQQSNCLARKQRKSRQEREIESPDDGHEFRSVLSKIPPRSSSRCQTLLSRPPPTSPSTSTLIQPFGASSPTCHELGIPATSKQFGEANQIPMHNLPMTEHLGSELVQRPLHQTTSSISAGVRRCFGLPSTTFSNDVAHKYLANSQQHPFESVQSHVTSPLLQSNWQTCACNNNNNSNNSTNIACQRFDDSDDLVSASSSSSSSHHQQQQQQERPVVIPTAFVHRRNERERERVRCVNDAYETLRRRVPEEFDAIRVGAGGVLTRLDRRISKVETLRSAIRYINFLLGLVNSQ